MKYSIVTGMSDCTNPDCLCHGIEPKRFSYLSNRDKETAFRSALSKLRNAREEIARLADGGFCIDGDVDWVLDHLDEAIAAWEKEQKAAAARYGFTIIEGIGHSDHARSRQ